MRVFMSEPSRGRQITDRTLWHRGDDEGCRLMSLDAEAEAHRILAETEPMTHDGRSSAGHPCAYHVFDYEPALALAESLVAFVKES